MPVIRLNDAIFADLKSISTWLGTTTPSETVDILVRESMKKLDLERDLDTVPSNSDVLEFKTAPGLLFTRVLSASIHNVPIEKLNWTGLLKSMIMTVKAKGLAGQELVNELQIPAKVTMYKGEGYKYYPDLGISVQGQSASDAWKEVDRLAKKLRIPVEVQFQWRENLKAQHPGRLGILRTGGDKQTMR